MQTCVLLSLLFSFILFCLIPLSSGIQIGFSPASLSFSDDSELCKQITIFSDRELNVSFDSRWSSIESNQLKDYNARINSLLYPTDVSVIGSRNVSICLVQGEHKYTHGLILMSFENSSFVGGIWVTLSGKGEISDAVMRKENGLAYDGFVSLSLPQEKVEISTILILVLSEISVSAGAIILITLLAKRSMPN